MQRLAQIEIDDEFRYTFGTDREWAIYLQAGLGVAWDFQGVIASAIGDVRVGRIRHINKQANPLIVAGGQGLIIQKKLASAVGQLQQVDLLRGCKHEIKRVAIGGVHLHLGELDHYGGNTVDRCIGDAQ